MEANTATKTGPSTPTTKGKYSSKQQQLVDSLIEGIASLLMPELTDIKTQLASLAANKTVMDSAVLARVEVLEFGGGSKRPPRTERKTGKTARKSNTGASQPHSGKPTNPWDKVKNAMLFFRRKFTEDEYRTRYFTPEAVESVEANATCRKKTKDSEDYFLAAGQCVWKNNLTEDQKGEVRQDFGRWKEERKLQNIATPLLPDPGVEASAAPEGE